MASPEMEAMARQRGFHDYDTMMAWMRQRSDSLHNSHTSTDSVMAQPQATQAPNGPPVQHVAPTMGGIWSRIQQALGY